MAFFRSSNLFALFAQFAEWDVLLGFGRFYEFRKSICHPWKQHGVNSGKLHRRSCHLAGITTSRMRNLPWTGSSYAKLGVLKGYYGGTQDAHYYVLLVVAHRLAGRFRAGALHVHPITRCESVV